MIQRILTFLQSCHICHGMGTRETQKGDTIPCVACNGRGLK